MKKRSLSPRQTQIRNWGLTSLVVLATATPFALIQKSQFTDIATLTYKALLNQIDQQENRQQINTYGFWADDPKLELFYGQDANLNTNILSKVNRQSFAYTSAAADGTQELANSNLPSLKIATSLGFQVGQNQVKWNQNSQSPIYNANLKTSPKTIRKINDIIKSTWQNTYGQIDPNQTNSTLKLVNDLIINQLGTNDQFTNFNQTKDFYQFLGAIGSIYPKRLNLWGHEGWLGEWIAYDDRDLDPNYNKTKAFATLEKALQAFLPTAGFMKDPELTKNVNNLITNFANEKNASAIQVQNLFIGPVLNKIAALANQFLQGTNLTNPHVLFPFLRQSNIAFIGFDPLQNFQTIDFISQNNQLSDPEKALLAQLLTTKLNQISQVITIDWAQWVDAQSELLKDPALIAALKKPDPTQAAKIIDKFIANFQANQNQPVAFTTTQSRVLNQQSIDRNQEAISFIFDQLMLSSNDELLNQYLNANFDINQSEIGKILFEPWLPSGTKALANFLKSPISGISYDPNQPQLLTNLWFVILASNWKTFANEAQINLISTTFKPFQLDQPNPDWKTHTQQYLAIGKMLISSFNLPHNFDALLQQGAISYQQANQRLSIIQNVIQDQYSTSGKIDPELQTVYNQAATQVLKIENKVSILGALVNSFSQLSSRFFNDITNQSAFQTYLTIKYGVGQDLIERLSQLQVVLDERFKTMRNWVFNALLGVKGRKPIIQSSNFSFNDWTKDFAWLDLKPFQSGANPVFNFKYEDQFQDPGRSEGSALALSPQEIAQMEVNLNSIFNAGQRIFFNTISLDLLNLATSNQDAKLSTLFTKLYPNDKNLTNLIKNPVNQNAFKNQILIALNNWTSFWQKQWKVDHPNFNNNNFFSSANLINNLTIMTTFNLNDQFVFVQALKNLWIQVKSKNSSSPDFITLASQIFPDLKNLNQVDQIWTKSANDPQYINTLHQQYLNQAISETSFIQATKVMIRNAFINLGLEKYNDLSTTSQQNLNQLVEQIWTSFKQYPNQFTKWQQAVQLEPVLAALTIDQNGWIKSLFYQIQSQANQFANQFINSNPNRNINQDLKILKQWKPAQMFQLADLIMINPILVHPYNTFTSVTAGSGPQYGSPIAISSQFNQIGIPNLKAFLNLGVTNLYGFLKTGGLQINLDLLKQNFQTTTTNQSLLSFNQSVAIDQNQSQLIVDYSNNGFWNQALFYQNQTSANQVWSSLNQAGLAPALITQERSHFLTNASISHLQASQNSKLANLINHNNFILNGKFLTTFKLFQPINLVKNNYPNPFALFNPVQSEQATISHQQAKSWIDLANPPFNDFYQLVDFNQNPNWTNWTIEHPLIKYLNVFNNPLINQTFSKTNSTLNQLKTIIKSTNDVKSMQNLFQNNYDRLNDQVNNFHYWKQLSQQQLLSAASLFKDLGTQGTWDWLAVLNGLGGLGSPITALISALNSPSLKLGYWQSLPANFGAIANQNAYLKPEQNATIQNQPSNPFQFQSLNATSGVDFTTKQLMTLSTQLFNNDPYAWKQILGENHPLSTQLKTLITKNLSNIIEHQQDALIFDLSNRRVNSATAIRSDGLTSTKFIDLNQKFESFLVNNTSIMIESFNSLNFTNDYYDGLDLVQPVFTGGKFNNQQTYGAAGQFLKFSTADLLNGMSSTIVSVRNRDALKDFPLEYDQNADLNQIYTVLPTNQLPESGLGGIFDDRSAAIKGFENGNRWWNFLGGIGNIIATVKRNSTANRLKQFIMNKQELPVIKALPYLPTPLVQQLLTDANGGPDTQWQHNLLAYSTLTLQIVQLPNGNAGLKVVQDIFDNGSSAYVYLEQGDDYNQGEPLNLFGLSYVSRVLLQPSSQVNGHLLKNWLDPTNGLVANILAKAKPVSLDPDLDLGFNGIEQSKVFKQSTPGDFGNQAVNGLVKNWNQLLKTAALNLTPEQIGYQAPWFNIDIDNRFDVIKSVLATTTISELSITWTKVNSTNPKGALSFDFQFEIGGNVANLDPNVIKTRVNRISIKDLPVEFSFSQKINELLKIINIQNLNLNSVGFNKQQILRDFYKANLPDQDLLEQDYKKALRWANDQEVLYQYVDFWTKWIGIANNQSRQFEADQLDQLKAYSQAQNNLLTIASGFTNQSESQFVIDYEALQQTNLAFKTNLQQIITDEDLAVVFLKELQTLNNQFSQNQANLKVDQAFGRSYHQNASLITTEDKLRFLANAINAGWANGTTIDGKYQNPNQIDQSVIRLDVQVGDVFSVMVNVSDSVFANHFNPITINDQARNQIFTGKPQADGNYLWEFNTTDTTNQLTFTNFTNVDGALTPNEYLIKVDATKIKELKTVFEINLVQNPANYDNITIANSPSADFLVNGPYSKDWFLASQQFELSPYNQWNADTFKKLHEQGQLELIFSDDPDQLVANYFASQGWDQNHIEVIAYESAKALDDPTRFNKYLMKNPFKIFKSKLEKETGTIHDIISVKTPNLATNDQTVYQLSDSHYSSAITWQAINQFSPDLLIDLTWLQQAIVDLSDQFQTGDQIVWGEVDPQLKINDPVFDQNRSLVKIDFGLLKPATIKTVFVNETSNLQFQFKPQTLYKLSISRKFNNDVIKFNKYVYYTTDSILNISQHNSLNKIAYLEQYFNLPSTTFNEKLQFNQFFDDGSWQMLLHNQALITNNQAPIDQLEAQKYDLTLSTILAIIKNQQALLGQSGANQLDVDVIKRQIVNKIQAVAHFVQQGFGSNTFDVLLNNSFLNYLELFNDNQIKQLDADLNRILIAIKDTQAEIDKLVNTKIQALAIQKQLITINATLNQIQLLTQSDQASHPDQVALLPTAWYDPNDYEADGITPKNLANPKSLNLWFKTIVVEKVLGLEVGPEQMLRVANQDQPGGWNALDQLYFSANQTHLNIETTVKNLYLGFLELGWFKNNRFDRLNIVFKDQAAQNQFNNQWTDGKTPWNQIFQMIEQKTYALFSNQNPNPIADWNLVQAGSQLPDLDVNGPNFNVQKINNLNKFSHFNNASVQLKQIFNPHPNDLNNLINNPNEANSWSVNDLIKPGSLPLVFKTWQDVEQVFPGLINNKFTGFEFDKNTNQIKINDQNGWHFVKPMLFRNSALATGNPSNPDQQKSWTVGWQLDPVALDDANLNNIFINQSQYGLWIKINSDHDIINAQSKLTFSVRTNLNNLLDLDPNQIEATTQAKLLTWLTSWFGSDQSQRESLLINTSRGLAMPLLSDFRPWATTSYGDWGGKSFFQTLMSNPNWITAWLNELKSNIDRNQIKDEITTVDDLTVANGTNNNWNQISWLFLQTTIDQILASKIFSDNYDDAINAISTFDYNQIRDLINQNTSSNDPNRISISLNQATKLVGDQFQISNQIVSQSNQQINFYQNQLAKQQQQQNDLIYEKSQILSQGSSMYLMLSTLFVTNQSVYQAWNDLLTVDLPFKDKLETIRSTINEQIKNFPQDQQLVKMLSVVDQLIAIENDLIKLQQLKQQTFYQSSLDPGVAREAALYLLKNVRDISFEHLMNKIFKIANWQGNLGINLTSNLISANGLWSFEQIKDFDDQVEPLADHPGLLKTKSIQFLGSVFETNLNKRSYFIISIPLAFASDSPQAISEKFRIFFANDEYIALNGLNTWMQRVMNQPLATSLLNENNEKLFRTTNAKAHKLANGQTFIHFGYNPFDPQSKPTQANRSTLLFNQSPIYNDYFFKEKTYLATIKPLQPFANATQNQNQKILNQLGYFQLETINQFSNFDQIFDLNVQNQMQIFAKKNRFFKVATVAKANDAFGQDQYQLLDHIGNEKFNVLKSEVNPSINASGSRPGWIYYDRVVLVDQLQPDLNNPSGQKAAIILTKPSTLSTNQWISFIDNLLNRSFFVANDLISTTVLPAAAKAILNPLLSGQTNLISIAMSDLKLLAAALKFELKTSAIDPYLSGAANLFSDQNRVIIELAHQNSAQDLITNNKFTLLNLVIKISAKTNIPFVFSPKLILLKNAILEKSLVNPNISKDFAKFNQRDLFSQLKGLLTNEIQDHFLTTTLKTTTSNLNQQFNDLNYILETLFSQATYVNFNYRKYFDPLLNQTSPTIVPMIERVPLIISEIVSDPQHQNLFATLINHLTSDQPLANIKATLIAANIISFEQTNPQPAQFVINPSYALSSQLNYATTDLKTISLELSFLDLKDPIKAAAKAQGLLNTPLQFDGIQKYVNFHLVENQIMTTLSTTPVQFSLANLLSPSALNANIHYQNQQILNALDQVGQAWQALITTTSLRYETSAQTNQYDLVVQPTNQGTNTSAKLFYNLVSEDLNLSTPLTPISLNIDLANYNDHLFNLTPAAMTNYLNQNVIKMLVQDYTEEHLSDVDAHLLRVEPLLDPGSSLNGKWIFVVEINQDQTSALAQFAISGLNAITMQNYYLLGTNRQFSTSQIATRSNWTQNQSQFNNNISSTKYELNISANPSSALPSQFATNLQQVFTLSEVNQVINNNQIPRQLNLTIAPAKPQWANAIPSWAIAIILMLVSVLTLGLGTWWWRNAYRKSNRQR